MRSALPEPVVSDLPRNPFRARDAARFGLTRARLYALVSAGTLERVARGIYAPAAVGLGPNATWAEAAQRVPGGVLCLLTALRLNGMTTQAPREVWMAIGEKARRPKVGSLPIRFVRFSGAALREGIEDRDMEGATIRVYNPAKTVADCFKYRNTIGLEVALEALRDYWHKRLGTLEELEHYAAICRVAKVMRPYVESLVV